MSDDWDEVRARLEEMVDCFSNIHDSEAQQDAAGIRVALQRVETLRSIVKGVHGALTDAATVVVPADIDSADLYEAVMQIVRERDAARQRVEYLKAKLAEAQAEIQRVNDNALDQVRDLVRERNEAQAEVERLGKQLDREHRDHSLYEGELLGRIERAEARLAKVVEALKVMAYCSYWENLTDYEWAMSPVEWEALVTLCAAIAATQEQGKT